MLESIQQGFLGLILFFSQLFVPAEGVSRLDVESVTPATPRALHVRCKMDFVLSDQMEQIIDAGIPLRFRMTSVTDKSDTAAFTRTMAFNVADYTYTIVDSVGGAARTPATYPMVLLAMRSYCTWEVTIPSDAEMCRVEANILPSRVSQLNRMLDMSKVWGQRRVSTLFDPREKVKTK
jgi:hypothetical protein